MVLGQSDKLSEKCNHNQNLDGRSPTELASPSSLCMPSQIEFDKLGNLYIIENYYEGQGNRRIIMYEAADLRNAEITRSQSSVNVYFPNLNAKKVFGKKSLSAFYSDSSDLDRYLSNAVSIAFNSQNQMVMGGDGYYAGDIKERAERQLFLYNNPLMKNPDGSYVQDQIPD